MRTDTIDDAALQHFRRARRGLLLAWLALLLLLAASATSARLHMGVGNLIAGVGIAIVKTAVVLWIFMAMKGAPALVRAAAGLGLALLCVMGGLSLADFGPRLAEPAPYQVPQTVAPVLAQPHPPPSGGR